MCRTSSTSPDAPPSISTRSSKAPSPGIFPWNSQRIRVRHQPQDSPDHRPDDSPSVAEPGGRNHSVMERRAFIGRVAVGTLAAPRIAQAQPARKVYRIGILSLRPPSEVLGPKRRSPSIKALLQGLSELGYVYGRDFVTEARGEGGRPDRYPDLVAQLIGL